MQLWLHIFTTFNNQEQRLVLQSYARKNIPDQMFPAALVKVQVEQRQLSSVQQTVALTAIDMCWLFEENKKKILKSGILLKSLSNRSNNEVTYYITVILKLTHSTHSQRQNVVFGRKKGNFGIFDPTFYFSSFLSAQC